MALKTFLGCFKIETGGIAIGFFGFVNNLVGLFVYSILIIFINVVGAGCRGIKEFLVHLSLETFPNLCYVLVPGIFLYLLFCTVIYFLCVKGVENRDHVRVRPLMIYYGILTAISFLGFLGLILSLTIVEGLPIWTYLITLFALVPTLFLFYIFSVLYSLYDIFQDEFLNGLPTHYHVPMTQV